MMKIKEISKDGEGMSTTKSSRKNSSKSLNTTLRDKVVKDGLSPCVSTFVLE